MLAAIRSAVHRNLVKVVEPFVGSQPTAPLSPWYGRAGLAAILGFLAVGVATQLPDRLAATLVGAVLAAGSSAFLLLSTWSVRVVTAVAAVAGTALVGTGHSSNLGWFAVCIVSGWCGLAVGRRAGLAALLLAAALFLGEWVSVHDPGWFAWIAGTAFTVLAALLVHHQLSIVEQMRVLQADLALRERAEERTRIARELHDVIAHSLTVSLLHISSARLAVQHDMNAAAQALADAERLTRRSLDEVRATVGILRGPEVGVALPAPGLDELRQLVEDLRTAHASVTLSIVGDTDDVPATVAMTAYRIVQESLTNVSRHVPGATATVHVEIGERAVDLAVDSSGAPGTGTGMGLANMRERADAVGGTFFAGPGGAGWLVTASLPLTASNGSRA